MCKCARMKLVKARSTHNAVEFLEVAEAAQHAAATRRGGFVRRQHLDLHAVKLHTSCLAHLEGARTLRSTAIATLRDCISGMVGTDWGGVGRKPARVLQAFRSCAWHACLWEGLSHPNPRA